MEHNRLKASLGQRWNDARPTKAIVFWACVASVIATLIVGFSWGGWMTGGTARAVAETSGTDAVVKRLGPICVAQFNGDPEKDRKLAEMAELSAWQRGDYVQRQGWATMPGEPQGDRQVATECARLITLANE
jgi:hypothetical protein